MNKGGSFQKADAGLFSSSLQKAGIGKQIAAVQHLDIALDVLRERFGHGADKHAKPRSIKNRVLMIEIVHPAVSEEIRSQEVSIISDINKKIGHPEIVRIQFVLPQSGRNLYPTG